MMRKAAMLLTLLSFTLFSLGLGAEITVKKTPDGTVFVVIGGEIAKGDVQKLARTWVAKRFDQSTIVVLESLGGDVEESLQLGRFLRKEHATAMVPPNRTCASACVFVLVGAPKRIVVGANVVIHRPYTTSTRDMPFEEREKHHEAIATAIRSYLKEMHISTDLYEAMESVRPEDGRKLSDEELSKWSLDGLDPVEQEAMDSKRARELGITMEEFVRRNARIKSVCTPYNSDVSREGIGLSKRCSNEVLEGLR